LMVCSRRKRTWRPFLSKHPSPKRVPMMIAFNLFDSGIRVVAQLPTVLSNDYNII
jgi:hypothetical protein